MQLHEQVGLENGPCDRQLHSRGLYRAEPVR
jgi:hypothetical protein